MTVAIPKGQPFAYQKSPDTLGLFLVIERGSDYPVLDMTTVTSVIAVCTQTKPDGSHLTFTWTLAPVAPMTTVDTLVVSRSWAPGDTDYIGNCPLVVTPYIGSTPLAPMAPQTLAVRGPALS
jgi:hypothetical protein